MLESKLFKMKFRDLVYINYNVELLVEINIFRELVFYLNLFT